MNTLSYKITYSENEGTGFQAILDGKDTFFRIDVAGLDVSRLQGGVCPLFFCDGCGMLGCAGYYANVEINDSTIIWTYFYEQYYEPESPTEYKTVEAVLNRNYHSIGNDFVVHAPLVFDKEEYSTLVDTLVADLMKYPSEVEVYKDSIERYKSGDRFGG